VESQLAVLEQLMVRRETEARLGPRLDALLWRQQGYGWEDWVLLPGCIAAAAGASAAGA
jgi:hypothetical protein